MIQLLILKLLEMSNEILQCSIMITMTQDPVSIKPHMLYSSEFAAVNSLLPTVKVHKRPKRNRNKFKKKKVQGSCYLFQNKHQNRVDKLEHLKHFQEGYPF